jgi:hypothetical protein
MKTYLKIALLTFLIIAASSRCYADMMITDVASEQAAKDLGAAIRTEMVGTNQVGVWLEFAPKGKLQTFSSVKLEIGSGDQRLVAATLSPSKQTPDTVVVYFSTDPTYLSKSTLTVFYKISGGFPPYDGIRFQSERLYKASDFALKRNLTTECIDHREQTKP